MKKLQIILAILVTLSLVGTPVFVHNTAFSAEQCPTDKDGIPAPTSPVGPEPTGPTGSTGGPGGPSIGPTGTLDIKIPMSIVDVQPAKISANGSVTITVVGGTDPYTWEIVSGTGYTLGSLITYGEQELAGFEVSTNTTNTLTADPCATDPVKISVSDDSSPQQQFAKEKVDSTATPLSWDYDNSAETIAKNSTVNVYINGSMGHTYNWVLGPGSDFGFLGSGSTTSFSNTLSADSNACGVAEIIVTDNCTGVQTTGYVRGSGDWVPIEIWQSHTRSLASYYSYHPYDYATGGFRGSKADSVAAGGAIKTKGNKKLSETWAWRWISCLYCSIENLANEGIDPVLHFSCSENPNYTGNGFPCCNWTGPTGAGPKCLQSRERWLSEWQCQ